MRVRFLRLVGAASLLALAPAAVHAQAPGRGRGGMPPEGARGPNAEQAGVPAVEKVSTTHHKVTINGQDISYTANAGTMVIRDGDGKPQGTVFYVAYTRDGENPATRPVTFFFNGGPGSSSIWLSMGLMSPMHPEMGPDGSQPTPPYDLVPNPYSPLATTDLVQIDAMMTGYSRPAPGVPVSDFTGTQNDIGMFGQFIRNYLDKYNRWASPKYLFGESYGTFRSAGLAGELQEREGIFLNGVMLLGTVLDLGNIAPSPSNDPPYAMFLPTYTATAWYHKKLPANLQSESLAQAVQQSRDYAFGDYLTTLAKGNALTDAERTAAAQKLAGLTGLSEQFVLNTNLRIDPNTFRTELLRDQHEMLGRYDTRLIGLQGNAANQYQDYDPSDVAPTGAFMTAYMRYLQDSLDYHTDLQYYLGGHAGPWNWGPGGYAGFPSTSEQLRLAMAKDPHLKVLVGAGYFDSATPFANAEYSFRHMGYGKSYTDRVKFDYYESGHMAYLNQASARQLSANIQKFIESTEH
ncbi:MAG: peptidase S10 [Gemmatimonadota bacterium]|nr:peptidase S10 [Gemmatimonadota bacterium]MDE3171454.1 peptidase S10 [Gemmatimonadota bacterium]MDE3215776.1 peptidase S10 [Gemmatimonadota bacterium]